MRKQSWNQYLKISNFKQKNIKIMENDMISMLIDIKFRPDLHANVYETNIYLNTKTG